MARMLGGNSPVNMHPTDPVEKQPKGKLTRDEQRQLAVDRIIEVTSRLCAGREFDELSVLEICIEADISVSSFYVRFPAKDDLLRAMHARYLDEFHVELARRAERIDWTGSDIERLAAVAVREYLGARTEFEARFRTMMLAEERHPDLARARQRSDRIAFDTIADLFAGRYADPDAAAQAREEIGFLARVVVAVTQDLTGLTRLFGYEERYSGDDLAELLCGLCTRYLAGL